MTQIIYFHNFKNNFYIFTGEYLPLHKKPILKSEFASSNLTFPKKWHSAHKKNHEKFLMMGKKWVLDCLMNKEEAI
jgi:hypothetical protein